MITIIICMLIAFVLCFWIAVVAWVDCNRYWHSSNMLTQEEVRNIRQHVEQLSAKPRKVTLKADRLDDYFDDEYTEEKKKVRRHDKHRKYR